MFGTGLKPLLGMSASHTQCLVQVLATLLLIVFSTKVHQGESSDVRTSWLPAIHVGDAG